jgi:transaldolase/glucose-6-phosphate isomerase
MNAVKETLQLGQSIWYDNIQRRALLDGSIEKMIKEGIIRGITSNPSIFNQAITKSIDYDPVLQTLSWGGWDKERIFWDLVIEDISRACDLFLPLYEQSIHDDGYVSIEVSPAHAFDTLETHKQAKELWERVHRNNLMIKIPATREGLPAIRRSIAEGINVNITLIFSIDRYKEVMDAFLDGLEDRLAVGLPIDGIDSVASFFISRMDTKIDGYLEKLGSAKPGYKDLFGKAAIANAKLAYQEFLAVFNSPRFEKLRKKGARIQRPLWASTSTKNLAYRDVMYIEELIANHTVNTAPPQTLTAFMDHGKADLSIEKELNEAREVIQKLEKIGISIKKVTDELESEGVKAFSEAFKSLMTAIEIRRARFCKQLGKYQPSVIETIQNLEKRSAITRMNQKDARLWTDEPGGQNEISNRLGWLDAPSSMGKLILEIGSLLGSCKQSGYTHALVLGMGGSSLAPEVFSLTFNPQQINDGKYLTLSILDSTHPDQVRETARISSVDHTLFVVSSKSGTTSEVNAFLEYFWEKSKMEIADRRGEHFIAITDPGTPLERIALERGFRGIYHGDPSVGGRYSVLTRFGLIPAGLAGVNIGLLSERANQMANECKLDGEYSRNPALVLGAILGSLTVEGCYQMTILADQPIASFGSWLEQLVAESSGKSGRGILPVDLEPEVDTGVYSKNRFFVYFRISGSRDDLISKLQNLGHPVLIFQLDDLYDLGKEFFRWEAATAIACAVLGVDPFDQPDVQSSKTITQQKISEFRKSGKLDAGTPLWTLGESRIYGGNKEDFQSVSSIFEAISLFLKDVKQNEYIALNAFIPRNEKNIKILSQVRKVILEKFKVATTLGFGPRYLHSTGQMHKGGPNLGRFLEISIDPETDMEVPGEGISFGTLLQAQFLGDFQALTEKSRKIIRLHFQTDDFEKFQDWKA